MSARVTCVGIVTLDQVYEVPAIGAGGGKVVASSRSLCAGGMAATAAAAAARLGAKVEFWGRLGRDSVGDFLSDALVEAGVGIGGLLRCKEGSSPSSAVLKDLAGERLIAAFPGSGFVVSAEDLPLDSIGAETVVLADLRWAQGGVAAFQRARSLGAPTVLDADIGDAETIHVLGRMADHIIFSQPGLCAFTGKDSAGSALAEARRHFDGLVSVTLGADGVLWLDGDQEHRLPAPRISPRDTTGAGDVFHGAFALAVAERRAIEDCFKFASAAAAAKCLNGTGWQSLPDRRQADAIETTTYRSMSHA